MYPETATTAGKPPAPKQPKPRLTVRFLFSHPAHIMSLGLGSGLSPIMPGTLGTLLGWLSFVALDRYFAPEHWLALIVIGFLAGIPACAYTAKALGAQDPSAVNWDETVAFWLVLLFVMPAPFSMQLAAFLIFRFFDMVKPQPIRYFDQRVKGGLGIMLDDIAAALCTLLTLALWARFASY
ncbi:phosphatidylglycerophosphatase A [Mycoavidus sp. SF9855]|uniref:phosphatidylglycerophosphatase A family protein n=1 Tax=Mycoavidus sp. SF9855 TaxID=2968475 RepID=UPI00211BB5EC|nr:phosphatidylglycerophosphatase A [Mycoavidus sp. SF9855]UUM21663.1 phosphatidylglycerophosphatase A [Mycoavidus sp. SF9855]